MSDFEPQSLVGRYFHTFTEHQIDCQGRVLGRVDGDTYLVVYFEWLTGSPNGEQLVSIGEMTDRTHGDGIDKPPTPGLPWQFYEDRDAMVTYYENSPRATRRRQEDRL